MLRILVALSVLALPPAARQQPILEAVESPAGADSLAPSLARGADGVVRLSWVERDEGGTARLRLAAFGDDAFGKPVEVARGGDWFVNWADFPTTNALADGTLVATWLQRTGEGTYAYGVRLSLSRDGGATWDEPVWLHEDRSPSEHGFVSLVPLDEQRFLALWLDGRESAAAGGGAHGGPGSQQLWSRTVARDGTLGPEVRVDDRVCDCCQTSLVATGDGTAVAAWRDRSEGEVRDIAWARFAEGGWSDPRPVHADGWVLPGCPVNGPQLAALPAGLACAWHTGGDRVGSWVAFLGDPGSTAFDTGLRPVAKVPGFGPPLRLDGGAGEGRVDAVPLADGTLLATWLGHTDGGVRWRGRLYAADGSPGERFDIAATDSERASGFLRAAPVEGGALLAWPDPAGGGVVTARLRR